MSPMRLSLVDIFMPEAPGTCKSPEYHCAAPDKKVNRRVVRD